MSAGAAVGDRGRAGLVGPARRAVDACGYSLGVVLGAVAAARRGKAVHPEGAVHSARLVVPAHTGTLGRTQLFGASGTRAAVVRFSRSLGLPRPLPDLLGMSIRVVDAYGAGRHQDFLMVSSIDAPLLNRVFVPAGDVQQRPYSSSLPYRVGAARLVVGALPRPGAPRPEGGNELDRLAAAAATGALTFDLAVATPRGRFRPVAELHVGPRLAPEADALRFNPWNSGGGLEPAGLLNRLRDYAYPLSQRAWGRGERAAEQAAADRAAAQLHA